MKISSMLILEKVHYLNSGSNTNRIQFLITNWLDDKHVVLVKLFKEFRLLKKFFYFLNLGFFILLCLIIFYNC